MRIYNNGRPWPLSSFTLCFRRWPRLKNASAVELPSLVNIVLSGIPAHAWELETAEHLLGEWCWVRELHADTINRRDYSAFRLKAWCTKPEFIPADMELVIVEPPAQFEEQPPVKRALGYDVQVTVELDAPAMGGGGPPPPPPPPPPPGDSDQGDDAQRRWRRSPMAQGAPTGQGGSHRVSVHRRLGQRAEPVDAIHVADRVALADGMFPATEATHAPTVSATDAPGLLAAIADLAALVINTRLGEDKVIPEIPGLCCMQQEDVQEEDALVPGMFPATEETQAPTASAADASGLLLAIDDLATLVINLRLGEDEVIPEIPALCCTQQEDATVLGMAPATEVTQGPAGSATNALGLLLAIDLAALVINPRLGEDVVTPEIPGLRCMQQEDAPVPGVQRRFNSSGCCANMGPNNSSQLGPCNKPSSNLAPAAQ